MSRSSHHCVRSIEWQLWFFYQRLVDRAIGHCINEENISYVEYVALELKWKFCIHLMNYVLPRLYFLLPVGGAS